jgi:predicted RNase H-like HicB family nuclease
VIIYRGEDDYWVAECPSLPGCLSQGKTKEDAVANIREAIQGYIMPLEEDKLPVPEERFDAVLMAVWVGCRVSPAVPVSRLWNESALWFDGRKGATWFFVALNRSANLLFLITKNWIAEHYGPSFARRTSP